MITNRAKFISRFLYQFPLGQPGGGPGLPPSPEIIKKAAAATKDVIDFETYRAYFVTLAEVIDACTAEEIGAEDYGLASTSPHKHPRVLALMELDPASRAGLAVASAQGLLWMENCRRLTREAALRNQVAMRLMTAILVIVGGGVKSGYTADQLTALAQIRTSLRSMDLFIVRARDAIKKIVGEKAKKSASKSKKATRGPNAISTPTRKVVRDSETWWQLEGESDLSAITIPDAPKSGAATTVRLTHSNSYGPFDQLDFFVRVGDPAKPTGQGDLDSAKDWTRTRLVEELVTVDDEEMLRSEAKEPFEDETPWEGTYEARLLIPAGRHSIEIKIVSHRPKLHHSMVLSGWDVSVG